MGILEHVTDEDLIIAFDLGDKLEKVNTVTKIFLATVLVDYLSETEEELDIILNRIRNDILSVKFGGSDNE